MPPTDVENVNYLALLEKVFFPHEAPAKAPSGGGGGRSRRQERDPRSREVPQSSALIRQAKQTAEGTRVRMVANSGKTDRDRESIDPMGWVVPKVLPKVLYGHNWSGKPVGKIEAYDVKPRKGLITDLLMADAVDDHIEAKVVASLIRGGFLDQGSVGFQPLEWKDPDGTVRSVAKGDAAYGSLPGRQYLKQELYEFSIVPVPSDVESVVLAIRAIEMPSGKGLVEELYEALVEYRKRKGAGTAADLGAGAREPDAASSKAATPCALPCCTGDAALHRAATVALMADVLTTAKDGADSAAQDQHRHLAQRYRELGLGLVPSLGVKWDAFDLEWIKQTGQPFSRSPLSNEDFLAALAPAAGAGSS